MLMARIAICRAMGQTRAQSAASCGTTPRMVEKWVHEHRDSVREMELFVRQMMPTPDETDIAQITDEKSYVAAFDKQLGPMYRALVRALQSGDLKASMQAVTEIHKVKALTTKVKVEHGGKVEVEHKIVPAGLKAIDGPRIRRGLPPLTYTQVEHAGG